MTNNKSEEPISKTGSLVCVGTGMMLGAHITPISRSHIEQADVVFTSGNNGFVVKWLEEMNSNVVNLQQFYQEGKPRSNTYDQMADIMLSEMRKGKKVVGAFYGHPGVFVTPSHRAIKQAKSEGYFAKMEAGISAEDCLVADCGIDPGTYGCAMFEASQFIKFKRSVDNSAYLVLWQVGIVGDSTLTQFSTGSQYRALLVEVLSEHYPRDHQIILYQTPSLAIEQVRIDKMPLSDFINANVNQCTTMILPPARRLMVNDTITDKIKQLDKQRQAPTLSTIE
ncbi:SAM-dependent methyltransferase [Colwelliaceae bacterium BS250]